MRTVFTNAMTAHVFAQQSQPFGHSDRMSFIDNVLSSYGTPIARIIKARRGKPVMLLTSHSYSVTTSHHESLTARAFEGRVFRVPSIGASGGRAWDRETQPRRIGRDGVDHRRNLKFLQDAYDKQILALRRMLSEPYNVAESLEWTAASLRDYAAAFRFKCTLDVAADAAAIIAFREARTARLSTPAAIAKRERDRARREARMTEQQCARLAQRRAWEAARNAEAAERVATRPARIAAWQHGETGEPARLYFDDTPDGALLRLKADGATVETSQGAEAPLADVRAAFAFVCAVRASGKDWEANGQTIRVGLFTVDRVSAAGDVKAGCHRFAWAEVSRFAAALGWIGGQS